MSEDIQILGILEEERQEAKEYLEGVGEKYREMLEPVRLPEAKVDSRVMKVVEQMNRVNADNAKERGREYSSPNIVFVDRKCQADNSGHKLLLFQR